MAGDRLGHLRVTVRFLEDGTRQVEKEDWRRSTRSEDNQRWRGVTFFRVAENDISERGSTSAGVASSSTAMDTGRGTTLAGAVGSSAAMDSPLIVEGRVVRDDAMRLSAADGEIHQSDESDGSFEMCP